MELELCGCSFSFGALPLEKALATVKNLGFQNVDLGVCFGNTQVDPIEAATKPVATASNVRDSLRNFDLRPCECFVLDFGEPINHPDERVVTRTRELFSGISEFAARVGCRSVLLLPGIVHPHLGRAKSFGLAVKALRELVKISSDHGVQLNVEPCEPSIADDPCDALMLCEQVPGLGLTLDYSHFVDPGYSQSSVEPLHRYTTHIHARQASPGKRVDTVASGTIDFTRILSLLRRDHYEGMISVEYVECDVTRVCHVNVMDETVNMRRELMRLLSREGDG